MSTPACTCSNAGVGSTFGHLPNCPMVSQHVNQCYGSGRIPPAPHDVSTPLSVDHLCMSCEVELAHEADMRDAQPYYGGPR